MLFSSGRVVATAGVAFEMRRDNLFRDAVWACLARHLQGDWGDLDKEDMDTNDRAVLAGERVLSSYQTIKKIWIITEADRSATTILFPDEY